MKKEENKGLKRALFTEEQIKSVNRILKELQRKAQLSLVMLLDVSGQSIANVARGKKTVREGISALVAGNFAASEELSRLMGEKGFRCLFHEGQEYSVYACKVLYDFILMAVFKADVRFGLVKLYLNKAISDLEGLLKDVAFETKEEESETVEMPSEEDLDALLEKLKEEFKLE